MGKDVIIACDFADKKACLNFLDKFEGKKPFVNIGMELSWLPCIGITLPLFSAGGSSSLCIYLALGIEMSVYRYSKSQSKSLFYT